MIREIEDFIFEKCIPVVVVVFFIGAALFLFVGGPLALYANYKESQDPNATTQLLKREWECTKDHYVTSTTYIKSGDVLLPITSTSKVCDQWSRK